MRARTSFVNHTQTRELVSQLEQAELEDVRRTIKAQKQLSPEEFTKILECRCFYAAIQYESLEFSSFDQQILTESFEAILDLVR